MRAALRRVGPWLTPALVVVELVLVVTRTLSLRSAVLVLVGVELLLGVAVATRVVAAVRTLRRRRGDGVDGWVAAEQALAEMAPRPLARAILVEVRVMTCLVRWLGRRHRRSGPGSFPYGRSVRPLLGGVLALVVLEGAVVEGVLAVLLGHRSVWVWVALGVHVYAVLWLAGLLASLVTEPHRLTTTALRLGDGVFGTVVVPLSAVRDVTRRHGSRSGRSGFRVEDGAGVLTWGDTAVRLHLHDGAAVEAGGRARTDVRTLDVSVDDPADFLEAIRAVTGSPVVG